MRMLSRRVLEVMFDDGLLSRSSWVFMPCTTPLFSGNYVSLLPLVAWIRGVLCIRKVNACNLHRV